MEQQLNRQVVRIAKIRKRDAEIATAKKKKGSRFSRLKKDIKSLLTGPGHSPAGKKYLGRKK